MDKDESPKGRPENIKDTGTTLAAEDVPDPEEDDLDDLDGMLQVMS